MAGTAGAATLRDGLWRQWVHRELAELAAEAGPGQPAARRRRSVCGRRPHPDAVATPDAPADAGRRRRLPTTSAGRRCGGVSAKWEALAIGVPMCDGLGLAADAGPHNTAARAKLAEFMAPAPYRTRRRALLLQSTPIGGSPPSLPPCRRGGVRGGSPTRSQRTEALSVSGSSGGAAGRHLLPALQYPTSPPAARSKAANLVEVRDQGGAVLCYTQQVGLTRLPAT